MRRHWIVVVALIGLLMPIPSLADELRSGALETFARDANGRACAWEPIASAHKLPKREEALLGMAATIDLEVQIAPDGSVADLRIVRSGNIDELDKLTADWIKNTWRWRPASTSCESTSRKVTVYWRRSETSPNPPPDECLLQPISETHTSLPSWTVAGAAPGSVLLEATVGLDGIPSDLVIVQPSGNHVLDVRAKAWVQRYWRWDHRPETCKPFPTRVNMSWE